MTNNKRTNSFKQSPQLAASLMRPFVDGARLQVERLLSSQQMLKHDPIIAVQHCHHETSNLFEDLATVIQYLNLSGITSKQDQSYKDVRDLIRHDIREEFDNDEKRKNDRAIRLGLNPKMQFEMSYDVGSIKIGQSIITLQEITSFINIAERVMNALLLGLKIELENKDEK
ncbi:MAG: hypothetical protein WCH58_03960 [Candidatus Saccharibacteria bacterium]